ncbi:MAG: hypothetical protein EP305_04395, partial [Bacteroidetes bacterium]
IPTAAITNNTGVTELTCLVPSVDVTATGGVTYSWDGGSTPTTDVNSFTTPGTYTVTATASNGCTATAAITITQDIAAPTPSITNNTGTTVLTCTTTSISVTATGGLSYSWDNGLGSNANATIPSAGTYTVTATGANGCTATSSITITDDIVPPSVAITNNTGTTVITCTTTSISVTATGGVTYNWDGGTTPTTAANTFTTPGTYTVTATGANGCTATASITITNDVAPPAMGITNNTGSTVLTCTTTSIDVTATGGVTYSWNNGLGTNANVIIASAGTYTVTATGANGCTATTSITITQDNSLPTAGITNTTGSTVVTCNDPSIDLVATGGGTYSWDNGLGTNASVSISTAGTYTVTVSLPNGCTDTESITITENTGIASPTVNITQPTCAAPTGTITVTSPTGANYQYSIGGAYQVNNVFNGLVAGTTYQVTVQDATNGCISTAVPATLNTVPDSPVISVVSSSNISCAGQIDGAIEISVTGGQTPYNGSWTPGGSTALQLTGLNSGTYIYSVTDANGCTDTESITITAPSPLAISGVVTNIDCGVSLGSIATTTTGGTGPFNYSWAPNNQATPDISGLYPGNYSVTVTDANGCTDTESFSVILTGFLDLTTTQSAVQIDEGESVDLGVVGTGTTGTINYTWTPSGDLTCSDCTNPTATPDQTTTYTVTATDAVGCTGSAQLIIFVEQFCEDFFFPNIFSPNDNGPEVNNTLCVAGSCIEEMSLQIFNRWGEKVFESVDPEICWDGTHRGKPVGTGVFAYKLYVRKANGEIIERAGNLTVVY